MTTTGTGGHRRCRSEIVTSFNNNAETNGFQRLKIHMQRALNWGGSQEQAFFNPEILANQKRQWYQFQSKGTDTTKYQDPTALFEQFLIAGIHPNANLQPVEDAFANRKKWEAKTDKTDLMDLKVVKFRAPPVVMMEPQILFKYPSGKKLSMRLADLASFCFPEGVKACMLARSPSLSELNQFVYGQEHLTRDDLSFIFSLKVADSATLYGVCLQTQEFVQRPPGMLGAISSIPRAPGRGSRFLITAPRCYCLLTRVPFFELHYQMLNSIVAQERLNRITQFVSQVSLDHIPSSPTVNNQEVEFSESPNKQKRSWMDSAVLVEGTLACSVSSAGIIDSGINSPSKLETRSPKDCNSDSPGKCAEFLGKMRCDHDRIRKAGIEACVPVNRTLERIGSTGPLFSSVKSIVTEDEDGVLSCSEDATNKTIMEWSKENKNELLQIICSYHALPVPTYGGKIHFKPLDHLQAIEYYRTAFAFGEDPDVDMSMIPDKVKFKLAAIEEAVSLSNWTTITICRALSLENVLTLLAAVLLEKQVIITSPNLGVLSATVLSLIPMILPFEYQSLFLPVLPGKMFDFLDAPVPFVVGIQHKLADNKMKSNNLVHVNLDDNQVEMSSLPALPKKNELITRLGPLHARLSSDKTASKKHPVYRCNKWQIDSATQFLNGIRQHLEWLCSNLSSHAITSIQCDHDRVSVLLKESYIDSFLYRDRPFIREFVDTQMFTVLSDTRLSRNDG